VLRKALITKNGINLNRQLFAKEYMELLGTYSEHIAIEENNSQIKEKF
jgi:hypothetical protein